MSAPEIRYAIIRSSGSTDNMRTNTAGWLDYYAVLDAVRVEMQSAGSVWDRPVSLLRNGKLVVPERLTDVAWEYGEAMLKAREAAVRKVRADHRPDWLEGAAA